MHLIAYFAVSTATRRSEICSIEWADLVLRRRTVTVHDRKAPRNKLGDDQRVPLVDLTG
jgi:integrase